MTELVNKIAAELSLWKPQINGLRVFANKLQAFDLRKDDLKTIEAMTEKRFDTTFPSFTFDMATGSGKTRLMGACISYLYRKGISKNFFVLAPGETIYRKLIDEFTKGHPKFVMQGWSDIPRFEVVTGENYERYQPDQTRLVGERFTVFIFNIDKFRRKDRKSLRFHRFRETLGASFGDIIARLPDLVLLMDESHHYRAEITKVAISDLKPILGFEFTATPEYQKNIIYSYSLGEAVSDYIVKRLEAIIRKDDRSYNEELDDLKLIEGLKIHEKTKVWVDEFCKNYGIEPIKPMAFVSTKNIKHGEEIQKKLESDDFMDGQYKGKTLYVHSGSEDEQIQELLTLENPENEKEIVIHVNKLKEGWDVKNIFTIIPLRASISDTLTEQTIGRGVRMPFLNATRDQIDNFPKAFTLHIITFSGKDDNYKDVIEKSKKNNIIIKNYDDEEYKEKNIETYEIKPVNEKHALVVPSFQSKIKQIGKLEFFDIKPNFEELRKDVKAKLEGVDIVKGDTEEIAEATESVIDDQVKFLIVKLIEETDEIDHNDKNVVQKLVETYLKKVTNSSKKSEWEEILKKHRRTIFADIRDKISFEVQNSIKVEHVIDKKENLKFGSFFVSKVKDKQAVDKKDVSDEKTKNIFKGYQRCVYSEMKFDSKQEKWLAGIVDEDGDVIRWLKNPVAKNGIAVKYKFGNYYPDFLVETKDTIYVLEVKESDALEDFDVKEKAREAINWCEKMSKISNKKWKYGVIPHDKINRTDSLKMVLNQIVDIAS